MVQLKTEKIKSKRGDVYTVETIRVAPQHVIFTTKDSFGNVVNTGKYKTKAMVMKANKQWLKGER